MIRHSGLRSLVAAIACVAVGAFATSVLIADTYPRQPGIKITNYTFDYTLADATNELVVKESVDVQFVAAGVKFVFVGYSTGLRGPSDVVEPYPNHENHMHVRFPAPAA